MSTEDMRRQKRNCRKKFCQYDKFWQYIIQLCTEIRPLKFLQKDFGRAKMQINQNQPKKTKISKQKTTFFCMHKNF